MPSPTLQRPSGAQGRENSRGYVQLSPTFAVPLEAGQDVELPNSSSSTHFPTRISFARASTQVQSRKCARILRYAITILFVVGTVSLLVFNRLLDIAARVGSPPTVEDLAGGNVQLWHSIDPKAALDENEHCVNDGTGSLCMCGGPKKCKQWLFQVGDVVIFEPAYVDNAMQWIESVVAVTLFFSDAMHVATVTEITSQTPDGIILSEALKPPTGMVVKSTLRYVLHRWPLSGFWIKRPDPARFTVNAAAIKTWSDTVKGQPFDRQMIIPFFRRWVTHGRFIKEFPDAHERQRALDLYASGGPGCWICTQLSAWLLAFPGGLNTMDSWPINQLQGTPGDVKRMNIWGEDWHLGCNSWGCYLATPPAPPAPAAPAPAAPAPTVL